MDGKESRAQMHLRARASSRNRGDGRGDGAHSGLRDDSALPAGKRLVGADRGQVRTGGEIALQREEATQ